VAEWQWQCSFHDGTRVVLELRATDVELLDLPGVSRCSGTYWDMGLVLGSRGDVDGDGVLCTFGLAAENGLVLQTWSTLKRRVNGAIRTGVRTWHRSGDIDLRRAISGCSGGGGRNDDVGDIGDVKLLCWCSTWSPWATSRWISRPSVLRRSGRSCIANRSCARGMPAYGGGLAHTR
jgi:hypothetical protein